MQRKRFNTLGEHGAAKPPLYSVLTGRAAQKNTCPTAKVEKRECHTPHQYRSNACKESILL